MKAAKPRRPTRDEHRASTLVAARTILQAEGLRALTARRLAETCGYAVGTLYNLFETTDALVAELNLETLAELEQVLAHNPPAPGTSPLEGVLHVARTALAFIAQHRGRWSAVLEFVPSEPHAFGAQTAAVADRLIEHLEHAFGELGERFPPAERRLAAAVLWAGFEGIVGLTAANSMSLITRADAWAMIRALVETYIAGLVARAEKPARPPSPRRRASAPTKPPR